MKFNLLHFLAMCIACMAYSPVLQAQDLIFMREDDEILECIILKINVEGGKKEYKIAKYQFLLNFLSKKSNEELYRFIDEQFRFITNVTEFIRDTVIPLL